MNRPKPFIIDYYIAVGKNPKSRMGYIAEFNRFLRDEMGSDWLLCEGQSKEDIKDKYPLLYKIMDTNGMSNLPDSNKTPVIVEPDEDYVSIFYRGDK